MIDTTYQVAGVWFPYEASLILKDWAKRSEFIQVMTVPPSMPNACKNCNGGGFVHLRLLIGSFSTPPLTKETITWMDGYWRVIKERAGFICPMCAGKGALRSVRPSTREEAQAVVDDLPGAGGLVEDYTNH